MNHTDRSSESSEKEISIDGGGAQKVVRVEINSDPSSLLRTEGFPQKFDIHIEKSTISSQIIHNNVSENKIHICHHCNKIFLQRKPLIKHLKVHAKERFHCPVCNRGFKFQSSLKLHMQTHTATSNPVTCKLCGQMFTKTIGLTKHMYIHLNVRKYKCKYCSKRFIDAGTHRKHTEQHEGVRYKCEICGKLYTSKQYLKSHLAKHLGLDTKKPQQLFDCESCPEQFTSKHLLKVHNNKEHLDIVYECEICTKTFPSKNNLNVHKKVHTTQLTCQVCNAKYSSREGMTVHMNKHMNITFPCALCSKVYYLERHRTDHVLRIHNN